MLTDGSKVLNIGDWGIGGMELLLTKADIYVASAGFNPQKIIPVMLDMGTDNEALLNDKNYCGV